MLYGQSFEQAPLSPSPETSIERNAERFEQRSEAAPAATVMTPVLPAPVIAPLAPVTTDVVTADPAGSTPLAANDDDLIEKEWVDQAKKIIVQTKDDPYRREQEVGKLQADYLRKRYGRELGAPQ
jgi:hypothetical protein